MGMTGAMMAMGAATKTYGAYQSAQSQRDSANYMASVNANNADIATQRASIAEQNGQIESMNQDLKTAQTLGAQRAAFAASGVDVTQGSALNVQAGTKFMGMRDDAQIQTNALREAWGYKTQANDYTSNAANERAIASSISPSGAAVGSLLGSASQVSSAWKTYDTANGGSGGISNLFSGSTAFGDFIGA